MKSMYKIWKLIFSDEFERMKHSRNITIFLFILMTNKEFGKRLELHFYNKEPISYRVITGKCTAVNNFINYSNSNSNRKYSILCWIYSIQ